MINQVYGFKDVLAAVDRLGDENLILSISGRALNDNDFLDVVLLLLFIQLREVAVGLTTTAVAEVPEVLRNRACLAIVTALDNATELAAAIYR